MTRVDRSREMKRKLSKRESFIFQRRALIYLLLTSVFITSALTFAQDSTQQTRPRRAPETNQPARVESTVPTVEVARMTGEPTVRIGLSTEARAVTISTSGQLLSTTSLNEPPSPLNVARVRIESRALTPPAPAESTFRVAIAGAATRVDADRAAAEIRAQTRETAEVSFDAATKTFRLLVGENLTRDEAEDLRTRIEEAGFASAAVVSSQATQSGTRAGATATKSGTANSHTPSQRSYEGASIG